MNRWLLPVEAGLVRAEIAAEVISPAYDLYPPPERLRMAQAQPRNFLNATLSEEDYPDLDIESRRIQARDYLSQEMASNTWLFGGEGLAILRLKSGGHVQTGVVGDVPAVAFPDLIRPHEDTRPGRVADLAEYLLAVGYGSSPVGLTYRRRPGIDSVVSTVTGRDPDLDVTLEDGDHQTVWLVRDPAELEGLMAEFGEVPAAYIVDGHHRVAATVQRGADPQSPAGRFLAVAFPDDDLMVYPFHRWVEGDFPGPETSSEEAGPENLQPSPGRVVAVTRSGEWVIDLAADPDEADVSALARQVLGPRLGLGDERTDPRIMFVPGYPDASILRARVAEYGGVGFLLHPSSVEAVMAVSDRGGVMPPKATFFVPKPRSGLFLVKR